MDPGFSNITPRFNRLNLHGQYRNGGVNLVNNRYQSKLVYDNPVLQSDSIKFSKELDRAAATSLKQELKKTGFEGARTQGTGSAVAPVNYLTANPVQTVVPDEYGGTQTDATPYPVSGGSTCRRGRPPKSNSTALVPYGGQPAKKRVVARKTTRGRAMSKFA